MCSSELVAFVKALMAVKNCIFVFASLSFFYRYASLVLIWFTNKVQSLRLVWKK
jgi:hypothetical protein